ncbi:unnamed protein product, partial [Closterium sp. NIES-54]
MYIDYLVFATADTEALALVKSELHKRHTCTDLGELRSYLGLQITRDRARRTITLTQSHMVHQVLQRFGLQYSSPQSTPLPTGHSLSAPLSDKSVEPSGPYPELVGCLMVLRYLCSTSGMGLVLGGRGPVVLTGHADASWVDDLATRRSSQGYTFSLGSGFVSWRSIRSSSVLSCCCEAEIYAGAMAAQELRWLTYLLTDLGERPRSSPVLYVDNKDMIALCQEHRLEHRTKHIALRYFLARELQQRGQLRLAYVATRANTTDILPKALQSAASHGTTSTGNRRNGGFGLRNVSHQQPTAVLAFPLCAESRQSVTATGTAGAIRPSLRASDRISFRGSSGLLKAVKCAPRHVCMSQPPYGFGPAEPPQDEDDYVEAHVLDAVRMVPCAESLRMAMSDGTELEVRHVHATAGRLLYPHATPAIFLKIANAPDLVLPIVVGELAIGLLMKAFRREHAARPNHYDVMTEMVQALRYE